MHFLVCWERGVVNYCTLCIFILYALNDNPGNELSAIQNLGGWKWKIWQSRMRDCPIEILQKSPQCLDELCASNCIGPRNICLYLYNLYLYPLYTCIYPYLVLIDLLLPVATHIISTLLAQLLPSVLNMLSYFSNKPYYPFIWIMQVHIEFNQN